MGKPVINFAVLVFVLFLNYLQVGHRLFDPKFDRQFSRSVGGMIWPRGFVGAAAFWLFVNF